MSVFCIPSKCQNLAVIEFKLATNPSDLEHDFEKLVEFRKDERLNYTSIIEVVIGSKTDLKKAEKHIKQLRKRDGEDITIVEFEINSWKVKQTKIIKV